MDPRDNDDWFKQAKERWEQKKAEEKGGDAPTQPAAEPSGPILDVPKVSEPRRNVADLMREPPPPIGDSERMEVEEDLRQLAEAQKVAEAERRAAEEAARAPAFVLGDAPPPVRSR